MTKIVYEWKKPKVQYAAGEYLLANGVMVASVAWVNDRIKSGYMGFHKLPDCHSPNGVMQDVDVQKSAVEKAVREWFGKFAL